MLSHIYRNTMIWIFGFCFCFSCLSVMKIDVYHAAAIIVRFPIYASKIIVPTVNAWNGPRLFAIQPQFGDMDLYWRKQDVCAVIKVHSASWRQRWMMTSEMKWPFSMGAKTISYNTDIICLVDYQPHLLGSFFLQMHLHIHGDTRWSSKACPTSFITVLI